MCRHTYLPSYTWAWEWQSNTHRELWDPCLRQACCQLLRSKTLECSGLFSFSPYISKSCKFYLQSLNIFGIGNFSYLSWTHIWVLCWPVSTLPMLVLLTAPRGHHAPPHAPPHSELKLQACLWPPKPFLSISAQCTYHSPTGLLTIQAPLHCCSLVKHLFSSSPRLSHIRSHIPAFLPLSFSNRSSPIACICTYLFCLSVSPPPDDTLRKRICACFGHLCAPAQPSTWPTASSNICGVKETHRCRHRWIHGDWQDQVTHVHLYTWDCGTRWLTCIAAHRYILMHADGPRAEAALVQWALGSGPGPASAGSICSHAKPSSPSPPTCGYLPMPQVANLTNSLEEKGHTSCSRTSRYREQCHNLQHAS